MWRTLAEAVRAIEDGNFRVLHNAALVGPESACSNCGNQAYEITGSGDWKCTDCEVMRPGVSR